MIASSKILYYVGDAVLDSNEMYVLLKPSNWDDFGCETSFYAVLCYGHEKIEEIGEVKIAYLGKINTGRYGKYITRKYIQAPFEHLNSDFCSLWQSREAYLKIRKIKEKYGFDILKSLNDIVVRIDEIDILLENNVVSSSLFRYVSRFECKHQFSKIYNNQTPLDKYDFSYKCDKTSKYSDDIITFHVDPESLPPTNIHAIIGSNGSGKTHTIRGIIRDYFLTPIDERRTESIFLISFNPFDSYQELIDELDKAGSFKKDSRSKKDFYYVGIKNIETFDNPSNSLNQNKNLDEMDEQFAKSYYACTRDPEKVKAFNDFIADMIEKFPNVGAIKDLVISGEEPSTIDIKLVRKNNVKSIFEKLSAGYKGVVSIVAGAIALMTEKSMVLMDEPENHLHPPLLSMLIRWLSKILVERNAFAIIATHSPIILQEIPSSCVSIMQRIGNVRKIRRPSIETFGANLSALTYDVFKYEIDNSGFNVILKKVAEESNNYEEALNRFGGCLGEEAKTRLRILCYKEEK